MSAEDSSSSSLDDIKRSGSVPLGLSMGQGKLGSQQPAPHAWVMGTPVAPYVASPSNRQASGWFAIDHVASPTAGPPAGQNPSNANHPTPTTPWLPNSRPGNPPVNASQFAYSSDQSDGNPYVNVSPVPSKRPTDMILTVLDRCGRKLEDNTRKAAIIAGNVWHHLKTSPNITDAALARLSQGTKVLAEGRNDKVFHQTFGYFPGEQLWNAYACYISTSAGPVIGILYLSTVRIAFCSDHPLCYSSFNGQQEWAYYKVVVPLDQLKAVNTSTNARNPSEKYIQIITKDNHEFWFLGFISYEKALKHLKEALQLHVSPRGSH